MILGEQPCARRAALRSLVLIGAAFLTSAHTPYRQWQVYRQKHLLIGTSKADPASYRLGQQIAALLASHLQESRARVTRGPDAWRLASLLTTRQLDLVLLESQDVRALREGAPPFEAFGPTDLLTLFPFTAARSGETTGVSPPNGTTDPRYWLVVRPDFPGRHAWQIAQTLEESAGALGGSVDLALQGPVPPHPGVLAFARGEPLPPLEAPPSVARVPPSDHHVDDHHHGTLR